MAGMSTYIMKMLGYERNAQLTTYSNDERNATLNFGKLNGKFYSPTIP
jgi:hypothetical protein